MKHDAKPPLSGDLSEQALVAAARRGDADAFELLVLRYQRKVLALTRRLCADPEDAQEAAQEAFLAAWQGLPAFRGEAGFSTWLYRLTSNCCMDLLRKKQRQVGTLPLDERIEITDPGPTPQSEAERIELRAAIEDGLRRLPEEYRAALILRELQQLRYEEIAAVLDIEIGTVKSRISRGRQLLRAFLQESGNFSPPGASKEAERRQPQ